LFSLIIQSHQNCQNF